MVEKMTFSEALTEVRKAHRILWNFYERLIPACEQFMREFQPASFYYSHYSFLGNRGNNPLTFGTMRHALPYMNMDILYGYDRNKEAWHDNPTLGDYMLVLTLQLDTGFLSDNQQTPKMLSTDSALAETRILLTTLYCCKDLQGNNWYNRVFLGNWEYKAQTLMPYKLDRSHASPDDADFLAYGCEIDLEYDLADSEAFKRRAQSVREEVKQHIPEIRWG